VSRAQLADALDLIARGRIKAAVDDVYGLDGTANAHGLVEAGRPTGRLVLKPNQI
jgi:acryloyl-coenzyme A reductase